MSSARLYIFYSETGSFWRKKIYNVNKSAGMNPKLSLQNYFLKLSN